MRCDGRSTAGEKENAKLVSLGHKEHGQAAPPASAPTTIQVHVRQYANRALRIAMPPPNGDRLPRRERGCRFGRSLHCRSVPAASASATLHCDARKDAGASQSLRDPVFGAATTRSAVVVVVVVVVVK